MRGTTPTDNNARLAAELQGKTLVVPNMLENLKGWPAGGCSPHYERLRHVFDGILDSVIEDEKARQKFKDSDFALFTAIWFPHATWDSLLICGLLSLWAFVWDDTIDTNEHDLSGDFEKACEFRRQTNAYCRYWLDVGDDDGFSLFHPREIVGRVLESAVSCLGYRALPPPCPPGGCAIFKELGEALCEKFDLVQRKRVYRELKFFFQTSEQEQGERLSGCIPTYDDYLKNRMGTTAFRIYCAMGEIPAECKLPVHIMDCPEMQVIWHETNLIIIIINDILSLKKEMATHCMINLVPIMYYHGKEKSLDAIIQQLVVELDASRDRFDIAANALRRMAVEADAKNGTTPQVSEGMERYLKVLMTTDTGTWEYSLAGKRYGVQDDVKGDGSVIITL